MQATSFVWIISVDHIFITVESKLCTNNVREKLGRISDCRIAVVSEELGAVQLTASDL